MKKISPKELNLLLILGGVLIFIVLYTYLFTPLQAKTADMKQNITTIEQQIKELEVHSAYADKYQKKTEEYRNNINEKLDLYPADIKEEDIIAYLLKMENATGIDINSVAFDPAEEITSFQGIINHTVEVDLGSEEESEKFEELQQQSLSNEMTTDMKVFRKGVSIYTELSYDCLKDTIKYIYSSPAQATLDSVSVSYSSENQELDGNMNISRYYITYPEAVYTPEELPEVSIGVSQLFGN